MDIVISILYKSTKVDLIDLICIQIHLSLVFAEEGVYILAIRVIEPIRDSEIAEYPILK